MSLRCRRIWWRVLRADRMIAFIITTRAGRGRSGRSVLLRTPGIRFYVAEDDYAGGICIDPQNPNVIYLSSNSADPFALSLDNTALRDHYEIWKGVTSDGGLSFAWEPITMNSTTENLRPYVPRCNGGEECVMWYQGTYSTYTSFSGSLVGLFSTEVPDFVDPSAITYVDATSGASGNTLEWDGAEVDNVFAAGEYRWRRRRRVGRGIRFELGQWCSRKLV